MQQLFSTVWGALGKRILVFGLMGLLSVSGLFIFANQPALAGQPLQVQQHIISQAGSKSVNRAYTQTEGLGLPDAPPQESYDEVTEEVSSNPKQGLEEIYEEDLKDYKKENAKDSGILEGAKDLVNKVTGKE
ncbi:hypothetical protein [Allocoleopsis franciscana]|uniref:Uncharacterized protein n=1 Tax=Allocoleopsis franciscana PCC 7113 TaxID=1173027 RepID=K9WPF1_9CYAN|nr:hypothetical protein [Allocoleopsis franciscana]AFZ21681.1 hypothetical protein Mic7113_6084 [Allocoleopsis franciscana PCC 7113]